MVTSTPTSISAGTTGSRCMASHSWQESGEEDTSTGLDSGTVCAENHLGMQLEDAEASVCATAVLAYPPRTRRALLRVIMAPLDQRAEAIGRLYAEPDGREAAGRLDRCCEFE